MNEIKQINSIYQYIQKIQSVINLKEVLENFIGQTELYHQSYNRIKQ